jgi:hypothetical protein
VERRIAYTATQTLTTTKSAQDAVTAAQQAFTSMQLAPQTQGQTVTAKSGSAIMAWMLGFLSPQANMPVRLSAQVDDQGTNRIVSITAEDAYPIPIKIGIAGKIRRQADALAQQTRQSMEQHLA